MIRSNAWFQVNNLRREVMERYVLVGLDDEERSEEYERYDDAVAAAQENGWAVVARHYVYENSELVWTPDGSNVWPPE